MPDARIPEREERRLPRQYNLQKKGKFITDSSQGFCRIQCSGAGSEKAPSPSCYPNLQGMHKRLVAGLSGLVTCLQSNSIGTNFCRLLFKLRRARAFPFSLRFHLFPFGRLLIGWLQAARWGRGIPPLQGDRNPGLAACQPRQPHSIPSFQLINDIQFYYIIY